MWRFPCEFRWDSWIKYVSDFITTHNSRTAKYYGWRRRDYFCSTLSVAKKTNKKTKQKSVAHLKLSFYSLEPFCLSMSCRRHCPPPKNGVEHRYLVTLESSIDSSSLSQPLRSKPDMQQSTFDTRRLVIKHFLFDEEQGHNVWTRWTKTWQQISQDILRERFWQLCSLCIWISLYNYRRECCAAERLPPHSSFIAGHNERLIQGENFFFSKVGWMVWRG